MCPVDTLSGSLFVCLFSSYFHCVSCTIVTTHSSLLHTVQGEGDGVHEPEEEIGSSIISSVITKCISKSGGKELGMKHANIIRVSFSFLRNGGGAK